MSKQAKRHFGYPSFKAFLRSDMGLLLAILVLGFLAHAVALGGTFRTIDDELSIVFNENIRNFHHLKSIFTSSFFGVGTYYRPLVIVSFLLEYQMVALKPFFYYWNNLAVHLGSAALVFSIFNFLLKKKRLSFCAALLFAIHPLQWEAVGNIAGRAILLCAFFYLLAVFLYIRYTLHKRAPDYVGCALAFGLALLSKESASTFILTATAFEYFFVYRPGRAGARQRLKSGIRRLAPLFALLFAYILWRRHLGITNVIFWPDLSSLLLGVTTFLRAVLTYLRLFILPVGLHFDRARPYFHGFADPELWGTLILWTTLFWALFHYRQRLSRPAKFFIAWFWLDLLPVSQLVYLPVANGYAATAEHFLYLPSVGFFALAILVIDDGLRRARAARHVSLKGVRLAGAGVLLYLMVLTVAAELRAVHQLSMFEESLRYTPADTRVRLSYGLALARHRLFPEAEKEFRTVLNVEPWDTRARLALAKALCDQDRCAEALTEYEKVTDAGTLNKLFHNNLKQTLAYMTMRYQERLEREPNNSDLHYSLGVMYSKTDHPAEALKEYEAAVRLNPKNRPALLNLAIGLAQEGKRENAIIYYRRMLRVGHKPDDLTRQAYNDLSYIYTQMGRRRAGLYYHKKLEAIGDEAAE